MAENKKEEIRFRHGKAVANMVTDLLRGSIEIVTDYRCKYHPDREATSVCESCGADLCSDCSSIRSHRSVCSRCMGSLDKALAGAGVVPFLMQLLIHPVVIALALATLLGCIFVSLGSAQRKGLLGKTPANAAETEKQFRLKMLLYARKADRIETHADTLHEAGRLDEARAEFERARAVYETLIPETGERWENKVFGLARARLIEKIGEPSYAEGLYENLAGLPGPDKTYPVIAQYRLAKIREKTDPRKALETYENLLRDIRHVPDKFSSALSIMAHPESAYNYEGRIRRLTRTDVDFDEIKAEALLQMGRILLALGRIGEAEYRLGLAANKAGESKFRTPAKKELEKLRAIRAENEPPAASPEEEAEEEERVVITHF